MIFTESTIKISNNVSKMDSTIVLYRGDKNVEIRFTILQSPFKYSNTVATNVIESTNASYGQLVIKTPNDKPPIFSEVSVTKEGTVLFTITKEMIDEIEELGNYTFQIRLMDENKQSRVTIPPVENGIEIKEPIAIEDDNTTNVVGLAKANYAVVTSADTNTPTFDDNGQYIKTNWNDGDIITNASLNKIEEGIYTTNENVTATKKYVDDNTPIKSLPVNPTTRTGAVVEVNKLTSSGCYALPKRSDGKDWTNLMMKVMINDGSGKGKSITLSGYQNFVFHVNVERKKIYCDNLRIVYNIGTTADTTYINTEPYYLPTTNTKEYTPTKEYHPATKKYADDKFICADIVDNVGTISKEEMQKCNNGTSRYVSSINFKEFFADYKYCVYQGTYGDKNILMEYDKEYNRMIAYDLDTVDTYNIMLGFDFDTNYMYPFNGGASQVKSYQFTNDLVIVKNDILNPSEVLTKNNTHEYTPITDYNPATKKYVDDKITVKILPVDYNKNCATNVADLEPHSIYMSPNDAKFLYLGYEKLEGSFSGFFLSGNPHGKFIYTGAKDDTKIEVMLEGICYTAYFKTDTVDAHTEKTVFYLTKNNNKEFTPTYDYEPATKKYVDDNKIGYIKSETVAETIDTSPMISSFKNNSYIYESNNVTYLEMGKEYHVIVNGVRYRALCINNMPGNDQIYETISVNGNGFSISIMNKFGYNTKYYPDNTKCAYEINLSDELLAAPPTIQILKMDIEYIPTYLMPKDLGILNSISINRIGDIGTGSVAIGYNNTASNDFTFAMGINTTAIATAAHAEGGYTVANASYSHAEGFKSASTGEYSHVEGIVCESSGQGSHAEGYYTVASGQRSHSEGCFTEAASQYQHAQGKYNVVDSKGVYAHIVGNGIGKNNRHNAHTLDWQGNAWFAGEVQGTNLPYTVSSKVLATVPASDIKIDESITVSNVSINGDRRYYIEFLGSKKLCSLSISETNGNSIMCSIGNYSIQAFNDSPNVIINIEKINTDTTATTFTDLVIYEEEVKYLDSKYLETDLVLQNSISLGRIGDIGAGSSAIGDRTIASGDFSHAEGGGTTASGSSSHAEGDSSTASGYASHAEGSTTTASGVNSHAEGDYTTASGASSHAEGYGSKASSQFQHVQGKYNIEDKDRKYAHIVGNGAGDAKRSNAHTLDWKGNGWYAGKLSQEGTPTENKDLATKKYVDDKVASLPQLSFNEAGELVVTINGVSKTFVPKNV